MTIYAMKLRGARIIAYPKKLSHLNEYSRWGYSCRVKESRYSGAALREIRKTHR